MSGLLSDIFIPRSYEFPVTTGHANPDRFTVTICIQSIHMSMTVTRKAARAI